MYLGSHEYPKPDDLHLSMTHTLGNIILLLPLAHKISLVPCAQLTQTS